MSDKNLAYYLSHPDEMPTDTAEIERLSREATDQALDSGNEQLTVDKIVGKADVPDLAAVKPEDDKPVEKPDEAKPAETPAAEEKPEGILTKDGKAVIPYSQLESARQRAATAEALAKTQADELAAMKTQLEAAGKPGEAAPDADMLTEEELQALETDSPTLAKVIRAQQSSIRTLRDEVKTVSTAQQKQVATEEAEVKSELQSAIDANPTLATWQTAKDQTMWDEAARVDRMLRESPKYANASFEERFAKVVEMTQVAQGVTPERREETPLTPEQIRAAAKAKLDTASTRPRSLSDIPGGAPPAVDEKEKIEQMSPVALGQMFQGMSTEQREAYLAQL